MKTMTTTKRTAARVAALQADAPSPLAIPPDLDAMSQAIRGQNLTGVLVTGSVLELMVAGADPLAFGADTMELLNPNAATGVGVVKFTSYLPPADDETRDRFVIVMADGSSVIVAWTGTLAPTSAPPVMARKAKPKGHR